MTPGGTETTPEVIALVRDAQAGNRHALNELLAAHLPLIYNLVGRALNRHADVDDVVQETMVQVVRGLPGLRDPDRFRSWVVTIAYRQIQLHLRERKQATPRIPDATVDVPDPGSDFAERTVSELNVRSGLTLRDEGTTGNQVLDSDFFRNYDPADRGRSGVGLAIKFGSGDGNLVRGCRAFHNADSGFDIGHFDGPVRLEHNWAYGNGVNRWGAEGWQSNADGFLLGGGSPPPPAPHVLRDNAAWDNAGHGFSDGQNPGALALANNTAFRNGGTGFHLPAAAARLRGNAAIDNASAATVRDAAESSGNTWDGGDWSAAMFASTDPATAEGRRAADGRQPATGFLASDTGVGASMLA